MYLALAREAAKVDAADLAEMEGDESDATLE
jgi:hypothetical protein